jgi:hypothetical protein
MIGLILTNGDIYRLAVALSYGVMGKNQERIKRRATKAHE